MKKFLFFTIFLSIISVFCSFIPPQAFANLNCVSSNGNDPIKGGSYNQVCKDGSGNDCRAGTYGCSCINTCTGSTLFKESCNEYSDCACTSVDFSGYDCGDRGYCRLTNGASCGGGGPTPPPSYSCSISSCGGNGCYKTQKYVSGCSGYSWYTGDGCYYFPVCDGGGPVCNNNGSCNLGETCSNCPNDCKCGGPTPSPTPIPYQIKGVVWSDQDDDGGNNDATHSPPLDGTKQPKDWGTVKGGIVVYASESGGDSATTTTLDDGTFIFTHLKATTTYTIQVRQSDVISTHFRHSLKNYHWFMGATTAQNPTNIYNLYLVPLYAGGTVSAVTTESSSNTIPLPGITVYGYATDGNKNGFAVTDTSGSTIGNYYIKDQLYNVGYTIQTRPMPPTSQTYSLGAGKSWQSTAINQLPSGHANLYYGLYSVSGSVYSDANGNNIKDVGEKTVKATVSLYAGSGDYTGRIIASSDTYGNYLYPTYATFRDNNNGKYRGLTKDHKYYAQVLAADIPAGYSNAVGVSATFTVNSNIVKNINLPLLPLHKITGAVYVDTTGTCSKVGGGADLSQFSIDYAGKPPGSAFVPIGGGFKITGLTPASYYTVTLTALSATQLSPCDTASKKVSGIADDVVVFYIQPSVISGKLCEKPSGDCSIDNSDNAYTGNALVKVIPVAKNYPCDFPHVGTCTFDTHTFVPTNKIAPPNNNSSLEGVTAYGQNWAWYMDGTAGAHDNNSNTRWYSIIGSKDNQTYAGPCYLTSSGCTLNTRSYILNSDGSFIEGITSNQSSSSWYAYKYDKDSAGSFLSMVSGSMNDGVNRWSNAANTPCYNVNPCIFDTRTYIPDKTTGAPTGENVTAYHKFWAWDMSGKPLSTFDIPLDQVSSSPRWVAAGGPCFKHTTLHDCTFNTRDYKRVGGKIIEVITAYGAIWEYDENGVLYNDPQFGVVVNGLPLDAPVDNPTYSNVGINKRYSTPGQTLAITPPSIYKTYNKLIGTGDYFVTISNLTSGYHITSPNTTEVSTNCATAPSSSCYTKDASGNIVSMRIKRTITSSGGGTIQNFALMPSEIHSITGTVFIDDGKGSGATAGDGHKQSPEEGTDQPVTVTLKKGSDIKATYTLKDTDNGNYTFSNLPPNLGDSYTVSFSIPSGYAFSQTANTSYTITLNGATCTISPTSLDGKCDASNPRNATTVNMGIVRTNNWFQVICGDIHTLNNHFSDSIPTNICSTAKRYAIDSNATICSVNPSGPGIIVSGPNDKTDAEFGGGSAAEYPSGIKKQWLLNQYSQSNTAKFLSISYEYLKKLADTKNAKPIDSYCGAGGLLDCTLNIPATPFDIATASGDLNLNTYTVPNDTNLVILIDGTLTIKGPILVPLTSNSTITFATSLGHDIHVIYTVGTTPTLTSTSVEGFYSSGRDFVIDGNGTNCATQDLRLNMAGVIISQREIVNNRNLCKEYCNPAYTVTQRPDFLLHAPPFLRLGVNVWKEVAP